MFVLLTIRAGVFMPCSHRTLAPAPMAPTVYRELGQKIRARRERLGLTQDKLAAQVGLSRTSVTNVERGRQQMLVHQLIDFARALRMEAAELLKDVVPANASMTQMQQDVPPEVQKLVVELRRAAPRRNRT